MYDLRLPWLWAVTGCSPKPWSREWSHARKRQQHQHVMQTTKSVQLAAIRRLAPVDSASLEEALRRAYEDEASTACTSMDIIANMDVIANTRAEEADTFPQDSELSNGFGLINVQGYRTNPTNSEREEHFRSFIGNRSCGSLTRCGSACVDLAELGARHGFFPRV